MNITDEQILDIKCTLANVKKKEIAKILSVDPVSLSRSISRPDLIEKLNDFFNKIDPEINVLCNKLRGETISYVLDSGSNYIKTQKADIDQEKKIKKLEKELAVSEGMNDYYDKRWNEWQIERDGLLKRIWDLGGDREKFDSPKAM